MGLHKKQQSLLSKLRARAAFALRAAKNGPGQRTPDWVARGNAALRDMHTTGAATGEADSSNPLRQFFTERRAGRGIWKWDHYFDIYDRHFRRFRGTEVHILEVGIYSGGSLDMWRGYFGSRCHIYGVDIQESCKAYESDGFKVFIGDQADRSFWSGFRDAVPSLDIVIDDGGHAPEQQIVTFEELVPHLRPGGVFLCEDVVDTANPFQQYLSGLARNLNEFLNVENNLDDDERRIVSPASAFQMAVDSVHFYPFVTVVERARYLRPEFVAAKHGTEWQPFLR